MPRPRTCDCGTCQTCKKRAAQAKYRAANPEKCREISRRSNAKARAERGDEVRAKDRARRDANRETWREYQREWQRGNREALSQIVDAAKAVPCVDCGAQWPPAAMDLHHRDPAEKDFTIGDRSNYSSHETLQAEIAKCDVLCACCHRLRHVL